MAKSKANDKDKKKITAGDVAKGLASGSVALIFGGIGFPFPVGPAISAVGVAGLGVTAVGFCAYHAGKFAWNKMIKPAGRGLVKLLGKQKSQEQQVAVPQQAVAKAVGQQMAPSQQPVANKAVSQQQAVTRGRTTQRSVTPRRRSGAVQPSGRANTPGAEAQRATLPSRASRVSPVGRTSQATLQSGSTSVAPRARGEQTTPAVKAAQTQGVRETRVKATDGARVAGMARTLEGQGAPRVSDRLGSAAPTTPAAGAKKSAQASLLRR